MASTSSSKVSLEGKTRLPARVQDLVLNFGSVIGSLQSSSGSNETLATTIKNFAIMDPILDNSILNLDKVIKTLDKLAEKDGVIDRSIMELSELQEKLEIAHKGLSIPREIN